MPKEEVRLARERVQRFERLGGVDLSHLDLGDPLRTEVEVGTALYRKAIFVFKCGFCGRIERSDKEMEPMCTGPGWTDEHPPAVMVLQS